MNATLRENIVFGREGNEEKSVFMFVSDCLKR